MHLAYIDDSKADGVIVFSALLVPVDQWQASLDHFIGMRKQMKASDGAHGLFAVRQAERPRKARAARYSADAQRYRPRGTGATAPVIADDDLAPGEAPKYRRKERAWDRAAKLEDEA